MFILIRKYTYGQPINTDATVYNLMPETSEIQDLELIRSDDGSISFIYRMGKNTIVYGLGEANRGINKRGHIYESFCSDDPLHTEEKRSLYGAHNFIVISGNKNIGIFADTPAQIQFDIGYTDENIIRITPSENDIDIYIIDGKSAYDIVKQFRRLIGKSYIAPRWAFGFQQSRWSYYTADDIRRVVKGYRDNGIPLDAVYMDIDYMERYKDFTVSDERFPDFENFVKEMREQGIHLVPIIDAGVKTEEGYDIYEEGIKNGYFCKKADGTYFTAGVWPGNTHFPDFLNKDAREWFGSKYKVLLDAGIDGFWNDMNEPAMFYTEDGVKEAVEYIKDFDFSNIDSGTFFSLRDKLSGLANRRKDYESFYHNIDGKMVRHDKVHNIFGYNMTRAAGEAFEKLSPDKRILMFSRSSYIGMHRYGGIWTGDNQSWWAHLLLNIKMMPSLNMCGFLYSGADLGGFGSNCTRDLLLRWLAFGIFTPLMRNHTALGTRDQECYRFGSTEEFKNIISLRYALIPYLYSEYMKACLNDDMLFKPLSFEYPDDDIARQIEDQLLVGESIMITPVYQQNAEGRYVYLPEDMLFMCFTSLDNFTCNVMQKGVHYISVKINEVPLFIRKNKLLPLGLPAECTDKLNTSALTIFACGRDKIEYTLYEDDGLSKNYNSPDNFLKFILHDPENPDVLPSSKNITKTYTFS